jgi:hypothetical protein
MAYTKYSLTPANNNAAPPDGAPEGMLPSAVNDTMRDMMAQIRDVGDGIRGGTYTMTAPVITGGSITGVALSGNTLTNPVITGGSINNTTIGATTAAAGTFSSLSDSGNLTFTGTGNRILGDFSNATLANRVLLQTSTTNGNTIFGVIPNGTSNSATLLLENNSSPANNGFAQLTIDDATVSLRSGIRGTGTYIPLTMFTGGSERLRIDTSGNVGINISYGLSRLTVAGQSPGADGAYSTNRGSIVLNETGRSSVNDVGGFEFKASVFGSGYGAKLMGLDNGTLAFGYRANSATWSESMRITSAGDVGIGTNSPSARLNIANTLAGGATLEMKITDTTNSLSGTLMRTGASYSYAGVGALETWLYSQGSSNLSLGPDGAAAVKIVTNGFERMRIDSSGNLMVGATNASLEVGPGFKFVPSTTGSAMGIVVNTATGGIGSYHLFNTNATNNGYRFYVVANGGVYNYSGNNINLSDERSKKNIEVAGSYLDKICAIPVKLFNYKDETEGEQRTLGVIAQDVEAVAPEFVNNDGWKGTEPEDGIPLKTIYSTDLMFGMMKAIQELKAELDSVKAELQTIKGA